MCRYLLLIGSSAWKDKLEKGKFIILYASVLSPPEVSGFAVSKHIFLTYGYHHMYIFRPQFGVAIRDPQLL